LFPLFSTGAIDTGDKFTTGAIDTRGKFATGESTRSFEKIRNDPNVIFRGLGKMIHKKPEAIIL
jgi:hypothetical protein